MKLSFLCVPEAKSSIAFSKRSGFVSFYGKYLLRSRANVRKSEVIATRQILDDYCQRHGLELLSIGRHYATAQFNRDLYIAHMQELLSHWEVEGMKPEALKYMRAVADDFIRSTTPL